MLKFKDSNGHVIGELSDNDSEPVLYSEEDVKRKKKSKQSKTKKAEGVYEKPVTLQQDPNYIASGMGPNGNGGTNRGTSNGE